MKKVIFSGKFISLSREEMKKTVGGDMPACLCYDEATKKELTCASDCKCPNGLAGTCG